MANKFMLSTKDEVHTWGYDSQAAGTQQVVREKQTVVQMASSHTQRSINEAKLVFTARQ